MRIPLLILLYLKIAIAEEDNKKLKTFELGVVAFKKKKGEALGERLADCKDIPL